MTWSKLIRLYFALLNIDMNFLAHLYLTPPVGDLAFGNFIADTVKGNNFLQFSPEIQKGIQIHRYIDDFTDHHAMVTETCRKLRPSVGKYAGVVADIVFDHFLAASWKDYHCETLPEFAGRCYEMVEARKILLPPRAAFVYRHMREGDWLTRYGDLDFLSRVFEGMSRRSAGGSLMLNSVAALNQDYGYYRESFVQFFPELIRAVEEYQKRAPEL